MKFYFSVALLIFCSVFYSQVSLDSNKRMLFGFMLAGNYTQIQEPPNVSEKGLLLENDIGFTLGVLAEYKILRQLKSLSYVGLSFNNSKVTYVENSQLMREQLNWVYLQVGTGLNWLPFPKAQFSPFITFGPKVQFDISQSPNGNQMEPIYSLNFGVGLEKSNKYFQVAPELLYSYGLTEVREKGIVPSMKIHTISLLLYFKG